MLISRFGEKRRNMAPGALGLAVENCCAQDGGGIGLIGRCGRFRRGDSELIEVKRGKLRSNHIRHVAYVIKTSFGRDGKLRGVVQAWIVEGS